MYPERTRQAFDVSAIMSTLTLRVSHRRVGLVTMLTGRPHRAAKPPNLLELDELAVHVDRTLKSAKCL
jgi:hypothetical protein